MSEEMGSCLNQQNLSKTALTIKIFINLNHTDPLSLIISIYNTFGRQTSNLFVNLYTPESIYFYIIHRMENFICDNRVFDPIPSVCQKIHASVLVRLSYGLHIHSYLEDRIRFYHKHH